MTRGPKKHLKLLNAPKHWMLHKLAGVFAPRPSQGPHKIAECLPLSIILRNRLKYALSRRETVMIVMRRLVEVDGKVRMDLNYPAGFMDVISIKKTKENFRLVFDEKGRFKLLPIAEDEAKFKLCRVQSLQKTDKATSGRNYALTGSAAAIPVLRTHDGRTVRYPDPLIRVNDVIKLNLTTGKIDSYIKFDIGQVAMVTKGANRGRIGTIVNKEKHPGSFDIVHLKDKRDHPFATRLANVFVIGDGDKPAISIPKNRGIALSVLEEREKRLASQKSRE
jgi:small subunit ribosomal protein S4e